MIPTNARDAYEEWKRDNAGDLRQHAGKYVIAGWDLDEGKSGSRGVLRSFDESELPALASYLKE
eukprot:gene16876-45975_t